MGPLRKEKDGVICGFWPRFVLSGSVFGCFFANFSDFLRCVCGAASGLTAGDVAHRAGSADYELRLLEPERRREPGGIDVDV